MVHAADDSQGMRLHVHTWSMTLSNSGDTAGSSRWVKHSFWLMSMATVLRGMGGLVVPWLVESSLIGWFEFEFESDSAIFIVSPSLLVWEDWLCSLLSSPPPPPPFFWASPDERRALRLESVLREWGAAVDRQGMQGHEYTYTLCVDSLHSGGVVIVVCGTGYNTLVGGSIGPLQMIYM